MSRYQITSSEGVDMGIYEGATPAEALDAMARDAGYRDEAGMSASEAVEDARKQIRTWEEASRG